MPSLSTILHAITAFVAAHPAAAAWVAATLVAVYRSRTPAQWIALGESNPRLQGAIKAARGFGVDPARLLDRVARRVREGGHPVPPERILARYPRTMAHLTQAVQWADAAYLYDAMDVTEGGPRLVAVRTASATTTLAAPLPAWAQRVLGTAGTE